MIPPSADSYFKGGASTMDGLSVLVITIGTLMVAVVAYLGVVDHLDPVPDAGAGGFAPRRTARRPR